MTEDLKIPKSIALKLLLFLEANLTGQITFDILHGEIKSAKISESVRAKETITAEEES